MTEHFDVLIVGAGLSGIGAAYHLQQRCPSKSYVILEGRGSIGGTWDLFRYPGIRSDSDMYTLGYSFRPWREAKAIADGPSILSYVRDTASEAGIEPHIRFDHHVKSAAWSTADARWTIVAEQGGETREITANFVMLCSGYYNYAAGYTPEWPGTAGFAGQVIHPQFWPEDLDYAGKRVVVIGSGATAVTLIPEIARTAASTTMLQRSPTYVVSRPAADPIADWLRGHLPAKLAYSLVRFKNVSLGMFFFNMARKKPEKVKARLVGMVRQHLGPDYDVDTHFTPRYNPWDQRLCLVPDADLFDAIKAGRADVVTDTIETFTPTGIRLASGKELPADIVVTATGLDMQLAGGVHFSVDGAPVALNEALSYKGMMFSDVPNLVSVFGYTNASWTLKADLTSEYACRLLNAMDAKGMRQCTPLRGDAAMDPAPFLDFSSGYVARGVGRFPKQGVEKPWRVDQNYAKDLMTIRYGKVADGRMTFTNPVVRERVAA
ncbi:NAD(P)/FAD-dependent oxidoreductase [Sphingosinicellaceae bacterium]|nr:NAD(P)/FAD-dependent oxidoreductase [Sphingosinicellaceae bacterium]